MMEVSREPRARSLRARFAYQEGAPSTGRSELNWRVRKLESVLPPIRCYTSPKISLSRCPMKTRLIPLATFLSLAAFTTAQETPSPTRLTNDHYFDFERVSNAQISPDWGSIVYPRQQANKIEDRWDSSLWIMNADGSQHRFLTKGANPRWSSDGKRILYIADGEPRGPQIFVRWIDADGPATQVTHATDKVADARWSPDGKSIAFSMFVPAKDTWKISMPTAPEGAHWTATPRVVQTLHYRQDRVGFLEDGH